MQRFWTQTPTNLCIYDPHDKDRILGVKGIRKAPEAVAEAEVRKGRGRGEDSERKWKKAVRTRVLCRYKSCWLARSRWALSVGGGSYAEEPRD